MQTDAKKLLCPVAPDRVQLRFEIGGFTQMSQQLFSHLISRFSPLSQVHADQAVNEFRTLEKEIGQELALGKESDQETHGFGVLREQRQKAGARPDAMAELSEIEKRLIRRSRSCDLRYQRRT